MIKNLITESFSLNLHTNVSFVPNAAERALDPIIKNGIQNVTIVIDHGVIENDRMEIFLKEIRDNLKVKKMISYHGGEPTYTKLEEIRDEINDKKTGAIFAIGGGSTIDVGKALAVLLTNP
ncbi:MAG: iron-containing alcohol dehydrogenase, partial [Opitutales bacterium]